MDVGLLVWTVYVFGMGFLAATWFVEWEPLGLYEVLTIAMLILVWPLSVPFIWIVDRISRRREV